MIYIPNPSKKRIFTSLILVISATVISDWLIGLIPIEKLPIPDNFMGISYHLISGMVWLLMIWKLSPSALKRFTFSFDRSLAISTATILYFVIPPLIHSDFRGKEISDLFIAILFSFAIGFDEDLFSRGIIFGALEKYGTQFAAVISSLHFGILHFGNYLWGHQSLSFTLAQVLDASAFGYLCCGLMVYSRNIWICVIFHGLSDLPMVLQSPESFIQNVSGNPSWIVTLVLAGAYSIMGWFFIRKSCSQKNINQNNGISFPVDVQV